MALRAVAVLRRLAALPVAARAADRAAGEVARCSVPATSPR